MKREELLDRAKEITTKDRDKEYGSPEDSFSLIADFWQLYLKARPSGPLASVDVAIMMDLLKTARLTAKPWHEDSWVDKAGYSACGAELATETEEAQLREAKTAL